MWILFSLLGSRIVWAAGPEVVLAKEMLSLTNIALETSGFLVEAEMHHTCRLTKGKYTALVDCGALVLAGKGPTLLPLTLPGETKLYKTLGNGAKKEKSVLVSSTGHEVPALRPSEVDVRLGLQFGDRGIHREETARLLPEGGLWIDGTSLYENWMNELLFSKTPLPTLTKGELRVRLNSHPQFEVDDAAVSYDVELFTGEAASQLCEAAFRLRMSLRGTETLVERLEGEVPWMFLERLSTLSTLLSSCVLPLEDLRKDVCELTAGGRSSVLAVHYLGWIENTLPISESMQNAIAMCGLDVMLIEEAQTLALEARSRLTGSQAVHQLFVDGPFLGVAHYRMESTRLLGPHLQYARRPPSIPKATDLRDWGWEALALFSKETLGPFSSFVHSAQDRELLAAQLTDLQQIIQLTFNAEKYLYALTIPVRDYQMRQERIDAMVGLLRMTQRIEEIQKSGMFEPSLQSTYGSSACSSALIPVAISPGPLGACRDTVGWVDTQLRDLRKDKFRGGPATERQEERTRWETAQSVIADRPDSLSLLQAGLFQ